MKKLLQTLAISALLLAPASLAQAQVSFGIRIGEPPAPRAFRVPPQPGPDYLWVEGYWYPQGGKYRWHDGYWTHPPYAGVLGRAVPCGRPVLCGSLGRQPWRRGALPSLGSGQAA